ncbi:hypothetical protein M422DRAFT_784503 [Sphaerobolus stellatus SS14]|uniref:ATP-dependent bile acid permease n=1 Tax=Sphaerobolus stellatus (strain SS14) TaxID=990650 RepID=A0A0C9UI60_SPHS4|nr:hypothetical protein M422DRAFT_784503 [Sphaerobolus stellatus SS14]
MWRLCSEPFVSWSDDCTRSYFESIPLFLVGILILCLSLSLPSSGLPRTFKWPLRPFLTVEEAEALIAASNGQNSAEAPSDAFKANRTVWRTTCLSGLALGEMLTWLAIASYRVVTTRTLNYWMVSAFMIAFSWLPAVVLPLFRPKVTAPIDLFALFTLEFAAAAFHVGTLWYDHQSLGISPSQWALLGVCLNFTVIVTLLAIVLYMPANVPTSQFIAENIGKSISPEDYSPLWAMITFEWILPLIKKGNKQPLKRDDVWELSPTLQSRAVHTKFASMKRKSLFRKLISANALDFSMNFILTLVSSTLSYANPFFLNRILKAIETPSNDEEWRTRAYFYALIMFVCEVCRIETEAVHLWYGRRATTRVRTQLITAIYAKSLVRKDYSGVAEKKEDAAKQASNETKAKKNKKDVGTSSSGADIGKIVTLMSADATRVTGMSANSHLICAAPFEAILASVFLYQLLGISALAGLACLFVGTPLNNYLSRRRIRIHKSFMAVKDKRTNVLNELLAGLKLVKFYAWENRWMDRILDARNLELKWLAKTRTNQIFLNAVWNIVPIMVSIVSFFTYIMLGNELPVSVAFTAISLFNMIRGPLGFIPRWVVDALQAKVCLDRISTFLEEDEVSEQISDMKRDVIDPTLAEDTRLGILQASFRWNEIENANVAKMPSSKSKATSSTASIAESEPNVSDSVSVTSRSDQEIKFELKDINVVFPDGKLTVVIGPTASGKTALFMALLGEMTMLPGDGRLLLPKHHLHPDEHGFSGLSYAAQAPFLQHQSIRDNILFGNPYEEERYAAVLDACALNPDLEIFEDRDLTEVGSRGISLSGGQKARVSLARAVYARSKCVLLDDPLSAVDSHTALFLYDKLLKGPLLTNRTVVLITHNVELVLPGAYYVVRMLDGRIDLQGTLEDLRANESLEVIIAKESTAESSLIAAQKPEPDVAIGDAPKPKLSENTKRPRQLVKDEDRSMGSVKWNIYKTYMKATSYITWITLIIGVILSQLLTVSQKVWMGVWGEAYNNTASLLHYLPSVSLAEHAGDTLSQTPLYLGSIVQEARIPNDMTLGLPSATEHPLFYVGIFAAISFGSALLSTTSIVIQYTGGLRASRVLFKQLLVSVVRATMRWHDSTPTGRILNRFTSDIATLDTSLSPSLQNVNMSLSGFFVSVLTIIYISPLFMIPAIVLGFMYYKIGIAYLNTSRELRRMESISKSPIFANFSELLAGLVTVRAFSAERRFFNQLHGRVDVASKLWYTFWMCNRWLLLHYDFLGTFVVLFASLLSISGNIGAGFSGIAITSAMTFTVSVYRTCRAWTQLELDFNAVERIVEYLKLPEEPPLVIESNRPPAYWPSSLENDALIEVEDLVVRYGAELPPVLHGISFKLKARERVGLLGRTGSGKSTLAMSLLRFTDPVSGMIKVDGIDITTIGLHDLRSRITFVAQDAVLFSGTIRENIDPFQEHTDAECLDVLARVHLLSDSQQPSRMASQTPSVYEGMETTSIAATSTIGPEDKQPFITLDTQIAPGGSNFSQGQRQLLTMARALLRQTSIIILDEATSSIDYETDAKIQKTIREEFKNSLLLTVAHRLRTIIDYDRLIVLDNGRIAEFDTPFNLIHKDDSIFRDMCIHSGNFEELEKATNEKEQGLRI